MQPAAIYTDRGYGNSPYPYFELRFYFNPLKKLLNFNSLMDWKQRYASAHRNYQLFSTPVAVKDHGYVNTVYPKIFTSNGLTLAIINFLNWQCHRATRINVQGRLLDKAERQPSGVTLTQKKWLPSTTRKGTADISSTINGMSVMWEIKSGYDKPSEYQLKEKIKEERAGGKYFFIHSMEEFLEYYDSL